MKAALPSPADISPRRVFSLRPAAGEGSDSSALFQRIAVLERQVADQEQAIRALLCERQSLEAARNGCWRTPRHVI